MKAPIFILAASMSLFAPAASAHGPAAKPAAGVAAMPAEAAPAAAAVDAFHSALSHGNVSAARALLMDDVLIFESGGVERSAAEYAAHHLTADAKFAAATTHRISRRTGGATANIAWIATEGQTTGNWNGKPVDSLSTETMLLVRTAGGWRITHIHWSSQAARK
jgi:ketosteroid isomerase-like protein